MLVDGLTLMSTQSTIKIRLEKILSRFGAIDVTISPSSLQNDLG